MANITRTIEAIDLDSRTGLWCSTCAEWTLVEVDVAIVDAGSLELLRRLTGSLCVHCGAFD